jgi:hypothetical protein
VRNDEPRRPCLYCGTITRSATQVCLMHRDLLSEDWRYGAIDYRRHTRLRSRQKEALCKPS